MSLKDVVYDTIKERIVNCVYSPGVFLNEREIIEELNISRTPFREAANALSREGMVEIVPHRGILVTGITLKDVIDLYLIREQLEPFVVRLAIENIPNEVLDKYFSAFEQILKPLHIEHEKAVEEDEDLHKMLLYYADNRLLTQMMAAIYDQNHRIRVLSMNKHSTIQLTQQQHFEIIRHLRDRDLTAATDAMLQHIMSSKERALQAILRRNDSCNINIALTEL